MATKFKMHMKEVARASVKHVRISPQKLRLVVDMIRGMQIEPALQVLQFSSNKGAAMALKLLKSAVANAKEKGGIDVDALWVSAIFVDAGRTMKRIMPRAQGRADQIHKRSSHMTVVVGEKA